MPFDVVSYSMLKKIETRGLDASKITSGRLSLSRLPTLSTANHYLVVRTANGDPIYDVIKLSDLNIDSDTNWNGKNIYNMGFIAGKLSAFTQRLPNVAMHAPVVVTAGILYNGGPTSDINGSYWEVSTFPASMTVDLERIVEGIRSISFSSFWRLDTRFIPKDYIIEYSTDGSTWNTLISVTNNTNTPVSHIFGGIRARYIRLTVNAPQSGQTKCQIANFEVYGDITGGFYEKIGSHRLQVISSITPTSDNTYNLGSLSNRWANLYAVNVYAGDLCFEEKVCKVCGQQFKEGDELVLKVNKVDNYTRTVPIHLKCSLG